MNRLKLIIEKIMDNNKKWYVRINKKQDPYRPYEYIEALRVKDPAEIFLIHDDEESIYVQVAQYLEENNLSEFKNEYEKLIDSLEIKKFMLEIIQEKDIKEYEELKKNK